MAETGDGNGNGSAPDEIKDLYKLIGNYEATCKNIFRQLESIDKKIDDGFEDRTEIKNTAKRIEEKIANHETRITAVEKKDTLGGPTQSEKVGIWSGFATAVYYILRVLLGAFGIKLP